MVDINELAEQLKSQGAKTKDALTLAEDLPHESTVEVLLADIASSLIFTNALLFRLIQGNETDERS